MDDNERQVELVKLANEKADNAADRKLRLVFTGILGTTVAFLGIAVPGVIQSLQLRVNYDKSQQDVALQKVKDQGTLAQGYMALMAASSIKLPDQIMLLGALGQLDGHPLQKWAQQRYAEVRSSLDAILAAQARQIDAVQTKDAFERRKQEVRAEIDAIMAERTFRPTDTDFLNTSTTRLIALSTEQGQLASAIAVSTATITTSAALIAQSITMTDQGVAPPVVDRAVALTGLASRIDPDLLMTVFPETARQRVQQNFKLLAAATQEFGITDDRMVAAIIAVISIESPNFDAASSTAPSSAEKYRGRGYIQLTGEVNYQRVSQQLGLGSRLVDNPDDANSPEVAARIVVAYLADNLASFQAALDKNDLTYVAKQIAGGTPPGYVDRLTIAYNKVLTKLRAPQSYTVYLHFRDDTPYSKAFAARAKPLLAAQGFKVPDGSEEVGKERVADTPQKGGPEGPHVDYFVRSPGDAGSVEALAIAKQIMDALNTAPQKPSQLSAFTVFPPKPATAAGSAKDQAHNIGVWF